MRLLVLGGTKFLGRAVAEEALARGHELTLFTRGRTNPELFPDAERLRGDRERDLAALRGRDWDAVVDTSGYLPRAVRASAELLAGAAAHYVFVSSISVYAGGMAPGYDEAAPVLELEDPSREELRDDTYGGLKILCERAVEREFPGRSTLVRAGLTVGPHDPTGRFTYWAHRVARGGDVLAPGPPDRPVQVVDVRDLADWLLRSAEERTSGTYNAARPPLAFRDVLAACRAAAGSDARPVWVDEDFLLSSELGAWQELPLWIPRTLDFANVLQADVSRAVAAGLTFRPLDDTAQGALDLAEVVPGVGLAPQQERNLLASWRGR